MELREKIETINQLLVDHFGIDTESTLPMWRVVWSNTILETRLCTHTDTGIELLHPEVREVRKYQTVKDRYVLERLVGLGPMEQIEYPGQKIYYNPMWTFQDRNGNYLPPFFDGCKYIIHDVYSKEGKFHMGRQYNDPEEDPQTKINRVNNLIIELFGENPGYTEHNPNTAIGFHPTKDYPKG